MNPQYPCIYVTDCSDVNATARLVAKLQSLGFHPTCLGIDPLAPEASAALTILDALVAAGATKSERGQVFLFNVAPRDGQYPNGVPFGYARYRGHVIAGTMSPVVWGLLRRELSIDTVTVTDIARTLKWANEKHVLELTPEERAGIAATQFRSLEYLPLLASLVRAGHEVPGDAVEITATEPELTIAWVDNFGNCKFPGTSMGLLGVVPGGSVTVSANGTTLTVGVYKSLNDVPAGELGFISGSSGVNGYLELVIRNGSAAHALGLTAGGSFVYDDITEVYRYQPSPLAPPRAEVTRALKAADGLSSRASRNGPGPRPQNKPTPRGRGTRVGPAR